MTRTLVLLGMAAAAGAGCDLGTRSYELRGQVLGVDAERREVLLKHDDVPGLMSAMTMPFRARGELLAMNRATSRIICAPRSSTRAASS